MTKHRLLFRPMKAALDLFYPPQCLGCEDAVSSPEGSRAELCPNCWQHAHFITGLACHQCGAPLPGQEAEASTGLICDDCLIRVRPWERGCASMVYSGTGRQLVLALKHGDRPDLAPALADWLAGAAAPFIRPDMIVTPVPLHYRRFWRRKYNQSSLLARHLAASHDLMFLPDLLRRTRATPPQDSRNVADRFENMRGAITVTPSSRDKCTGRPVLLVDDVMTTGATLTEAAEALINAGSLSISVVVLARAVKEH